MSSKKEIVVPGEELWIINVNLGNNHSPRSYIKNSERDALTKVTDIVAKWEERAEIWPEAMEEYITVMRVEVKKLNVQKLKK